MFQKISIFAISIICLLTSSCGGSTASTENVVSTPRELSCDWTFDADFDNLDVDEVVSITGLATNDVFVAANHGDSGVVLNWDGSIWSSIALPGDVYRCTGITSAESACDVWVTAMDHHDAPILLRRCNGGWEAVGAPVLNSFCDIWTHPNAGTYLIGMSDQAKSELWHMDAEDSDWSKITLPFSADQANLARVWGTPDGDNVFVTGFVVNSGLAEGAFLLHGSAGSWASVDLPRDIKYVFDLHGTSVNDISIAGISQDSEGIVYQARNSLNEWSPSLDGSVDANNVVRTMYPGTAIVVGYKALSAVVNPSLKIATLDDRGLNTSLTQDNGSYPLRLWSEAGSSKAFLATDNSILLGYCH